MCAQEGRRYTETYRRVSLLTDVQMAHDEVNMSTLVIGGGDYAASFFCGVKMRKSAGAILSYSQF